MVSKEMIEYAVSKGYVEEQEKTAGAMAAPPVAAAGWLDDIWKGLKGAYSSGKGHVKTLFDSKNPGTPFGAKTVRGLMRDKGHQQAVRDTYNELISSGMSKQHAIRKTVGANQLIADSNKSALKGLGIVAGGTAAAGIGAAGVVNAFTPPKKVTIVK